MPMKIEAAIVTQKRPEASFNTDSVNVNGKVFSREVIKNGYKGSGIISGSVYFALTSSDVDGFADAAVAAFNERAEVFPVVRDARSVFSGFYEDCRSALLNMEKNENDLRCACFYANGRKAVLAASGDVKLYLHRLNNCTPVIPEKVIDTVADYGSSIFPDVNIGDIFILMSPGTAEVISEKEIDDICRISDGSVKRIVNYITKVGLAKEGTKAVSAIVVKILDTAPEDELPAAGFVPDFSQLEKKIEAVIEENSDVTEKLQENTEDNSEETASEAVENIEEVIFSVSDEATSQDEKESVDFEAVAEAIVVAQNAASDKTEELTASDESRDEVLSEETDPEEVPEELSEEEKAAKTYKKTRIMLFSILGVLIVISLVLIGVIIAGGGFDFKSPEETHSEETTNEESSAQESTEEETTEEETTEEETTEEETTEEEAATAEEETTRRTQPTVTPVTPAVSTTAAPRPSETTTRVSEETTTAASEETTELPTEEAEETTTAAVENSTEEATAEETSSEAENTEETQSQLQENETAGQSPEEAATEEIDTISSGAIENGETAFSESAE